MNKSVINSFGKYSRAQRIAVGSWILRGYFNLSSAHSGHARGPTGRRMQETIELVTSQQMV